MKKIIEKHTFNSIIWILVVGSILMFVGDIAGVFIFPNVNEQQQPYLYTFISYASFINMWVSVIVTVAIFKKNRYIKDVILMNHNGNTFLALGIGLLIGFILNGFCAFIAIFNGDIHLAFQSFEFLSAVGMFFAVFIQSSAEEVLCRGFLYQRLLKSTSKPIIAVLLNAVFFAVFHIFNDGITLLAFYDLLVTGIFFSLVVFYFDSLWMAMGIHTTWNFTQSILFGLPNSGASFPYSIYHLDSSNVHASFAYNVEFGLEGTVLSAMLMTGCCIILYLWKNNSKNIFKNDLKYVIKQ